MNRQDHICVLLVENDDQSARAVQDIFEDRHHIEYVVTRAYDEAEARRRLENGTYDVVLIDHDLGARTGVELVKDLDRTDPFAPPIIMLWRDGAGALEPGVQQLDIEDHLVVSDLDASRLESAITNALERKAQDERLELLTIYD